RRGGARRPAAPSLYRCDRDSTGPWDLTTLEELTLGAGLARPLGLGELGEFRPGDDEAVVGQGLVRPFLAFADGIEAVRPGAGRVAHAAELVEQGGGGGLALGFEGADEVLGGLPDGEPLVGCRVPTVGEFGPADESHLAAGILHHASPN